MKYFRSSVVFLIVLMMLILSSCSGSDDTPAPAGSEGTDIVDASSADESAVTSEPDEDSAVISEPEDDSAVTSEPDDGSEVASEPHDASAETPGEPSKPAPAPDRGESSKTEPVKEVHTHAFVGTTCTEAGRCACGAVQAAFGHNFAAATCASPSRCTRCGATSGSALGHSYANGRCQRCGDTNGPLKPEEAKLFQNKLTDEENAQALAVARALVRQIQAELPNGSDFDRIAMAAALVSNEYSKGIHLESGIYYHTAYGVFVKRESSCAGCCRALGLVLSCMGYQWSHVNENQWQHQWVTVTVGGETIWADGQIGWAGYGTYPYA